MKKLIIVICAIALSVPAIATVIETKKGPVEFNHGKHFAAMQDCQKCHDIHNLASKNASHDFCKGCHKELGQGPTKCKGCHIK